MASSPGVDDTSSAGSWSPEIKSRWRFTTTQNDILEEAYRANPNPSPEILESLVTDLHSPRKTIITWFQNRRAKERRYQRRQQRRHPIRDQQFASSSHVSMPSSTSGMVSPQQETILPVMTPEEGFVVISQQEDQDQTIIPVQHQDQVYQQEILFPVDDLLPSSQIPSQQVFWYHPYDVNVDDTMGTSASTIPTEDWLNFSAFWQYVYNQSQYLSDEGEVCLYP